MYRNPNKNNQSWNFIPNPNLNRNFNPNSNFNRNFNQGRNFNQSRNFNQNPYFNQRPNYNVNYHQNRNQNANFIQNPNPGRNFEVFCYLCNTPGHTSRNCNKQMNINQQLPQQLQEFNKQENSNVLPGAGAQRRA